MMEYAIKLTSDERYTSINTEKRTDSMQFQREGM